MVEKKLKKTFPFLTMLKYYLPHLIFHEKN
jgi:hypothetical protein